MNYYFYLFMFILYLTIVTYDSLCNKKYLIRYIMKEDIENILLFLKIITILYFFKEQYISKVLIYDNMYIITVSYFIFLFIIFILILKMIKKSKYIVYNYIPIIILLFFSNSVLKNIEFFYFHIFIFLFLKIFHYIIFFIILFVYYNIVNVKKIKYKFNIKNIFFILVIIIFI